VSGSTLDAAEDPSSPPPNGASRRWVPSWRWLLEWLIVIALALTAALVMRTYVFQTFFIPSSSMYPTLQLGDRVIVSKVSVELGTINRGDILVFRTPPGEQAACQGPVVSDLVKRVIGLPGDELWSVGNDIYWRYGDGPAHLLTQPWEPAGAQLGPAISYPSQSPATPTNPVIVPANSYFMMGDNESDSCDSRFWGFLSRNLVVGKVFLRIWPVSRIDFL
jgi:signal peptidase I